MYKKVGCLLIGSILTLGLTVGCSSTNSQSSEGTDTETKAMETVKETPSKSKDRIELTNGMYKVGEDVDEGEYFLLADHKDAYYQISNNSSGDAKGILANEIFSKNRYITLEKGQYLTLDGCTLTRIGDVNLNLNSDYFLTDGMFKVGKDIEEGEYKVITSGAEGYYEVAPNSKNDLYSIISNENFSGERYVTVKNGQYLKLSNDTTLMKK